MTNLRPLSFLPCIPETISYLERLVRNEPVGKLLRVRQIEALYFTGADAPGETLVRLYKVWGDSPALRQVIFFHYLHRQPVFKEVLVKCVYPGFKQKRYYWDETELKFFLQSLKFSEFDQIRCLKLIEHAFLEMKILSQEGTYLEYQRPAVEAVAYAFYAEYGDGFLEGKRFVLKNPPLEQILEHAAFPAYFLIDPRTVTTMLEACRIKNYISLEARGGLCQYALIYQDLAGLVEFMVQGGRD